MVCQGKSGKKFGEIWAGWGRDPPDREEMGRKSLHKCYTKRKGVKSYAQLPQSFPQINGKKEVYRCFFEKIIRSCINKT